jgi:hypothetical protein
VVAWEAEKGKLGVEKRIINGQEENLKANRYLHYLDFDICIGISHS